MTQPSKENAMRLFSLLFLSILIAAACHTHQANEPNDEKISAEAETPQASQSAVIATRGVEIQKPESSRESDATSSTANTSDGKIIQKTGRKEPQLLTVQSDQYAVANKKGKLPLGEPKTFYNGCLNKPQNQRGHMVASPGPGKDQREGVSTTLTYGGIRTVHRLSHNCCHNSDVKVTRAGKTHIRVIERLSGDTCKCNCSSVINTDIPVEKDTTYQVDVILIENNGPEKVVFSEKVKR